MDGTSKLLEVKKSEILSCWESRVRDEVSAAANKPKPALINSLPKLIDELVVTLANPQPKVKLKRIEKNLALEHGRERSKFHDYSLDQVIDEYHVLREVIFEMLENGHELSRTDRDIILDALQIAIRNAAAEFVREREGERISAQSKHEHFERLLEISHTKISQEDLENVFNSLPGLFIVLDQNFNVLGVSEAWLKAANYKRDDLLGKYLFDVVTDDPDDESRSGVENLSASLKRVLQSKERETMPIQKFSIPSGDGSFKVKYWSPTNSPVLNDQGKVIYLVHRVEDVTDLVNSSGELPLKSHDQSAIEVIQRNKELHSHTENQNKTITKHREILRASVEAIEDYGMIILDPDGIIKSWNSGAEALSGYSSAMAIDKPHSILYPYDAIEREEPERHLRLAKKKKRFRQEGTRIRQDHSLFLADVLITALFDDEGSLFGFSVVISDLTERDLRVQEKEQSRIDVESLRSEKELRDRFVSTLSHDLRTPLAAAKAGAQLIGKVPCENDRHRILSSRIANAVDRADLMLTDLLDVSRIKSGQFLTLETSEIHLNELLDQIKDDFDTTHGPRLQLDLNQEIRGFWDGSKLRRAIDNLLTNAVKYGSKSEAIKIGATEKSNRVLISVANKGPTIETSELEALFHPFHRSRTAAGKQGWGLGLTLVRGVAEAHGGSVKVQSDPESGTVFTIEIPERVSPS